MPIPEDIVRVQLLHKLVDGPEMVSNTIHLKRFHEVGNAVEWPANIQEIANKVRDKYLASPIMATLSSAVYFQKVGAYHLSTEAKTLHKAEAFTAQGLNGTPHTGGGAQLPWDTAAVVSLRTDQPGDFFPDPETGPSPAKRSRGRVFAGVLPVTALAVTGRFSAAYCQQLRDAWIAFLDDLSAMTVGGGAQPDQMYPVILSKAGNSARRITEVVVDDIPDHQSRRDNKRQPNRYRTFTDQRQA